MAEQISTIVVYIFYAYVSLGLLFAIAFAWRGVQKVDRRAVGSGFGFRCLILPGTIAFWPLLLRRWLHATSEPPEQEKSASMIELLRAWHRHIFLALLFLLPIIFIAGLAARHHSPSQRLVSR